MEWADGKKRCSWANPANPRYVRYHDEEWGVPVHSDRMLFEMLVLECFQAGLSWECVLNKRDAFKAAFHNFNAETVSGYTSADVERLLANPGIIRNRQKIEAAIGNAKAFCKIRNEFGSFSQYLWQWTDEKTVREKEGDCTPLSKAVSKDLKKRGMKFMGPTVTHAYLQAVGVIYAHEEGCFLR